MLSISRGFPLTLMPGSGTVRLQITLRTNDIGLHTFRSNSSKNPPSPVSPSYFVGSIRPPSRNRIRLLVRNQQEPRFCGKVLRTCLRQLLRTALKGIMIDRGLVHLGRGTFRSNGRPWCLIEMKAPTPHFLCNRFRGRYGASWEKQ